MFHSIGPLTTISSTRNTTAQAEEALAGEEEKSWNKLQLRWEEREDGKASEA